MPSAQSRQKFCANDCAPAFSDRRYIRKISRAVGNAGDKFIYLALSPLRALSIMGFNYIKNLVYLVYLVRDFSDGTPIPPESSTIAKQNFA